MRFLIDQQLPPALIAWLRSRGHDAEHVRHVGLRDSADTLIWDRALADGSAVITKDEDFAARRAVSRAGPTIVWLRLGNATTPGLLAWLESIWDDVEADLARGSPVIEVR